MTVLIQTLIFVWLSDVSFQHDGENGAEVEETPLPRNFWPYYQHVFVTINPDTEKDYIVSGVNISLRRTNPVPATEVTLHAGNMSIWIVEAIVREENKTEFYKLDGVTFEHDIKSERLVVKFNNPKVVEMFLFIESLMKFTTNRKFLEGAYHPHGKFDVVTQFEMTAARTVFPCFDDPHFQTEFQLMFHMVPQTPEELSIGLSNTPVEYYEEDWVGRYYIFEKTPHPIPAYLLAFALLNSSFYSRVLEMDYFGMPITFYEHNYGVRPLPRHWHSIYLDKEIGKTIKGVVLFSLAYCEQVFNSKLDWPKLDFVVTESSFGGMENPGLIIIRDLMDELYSSNVIVHEIVHQWTGVKMLNDWWSSFWINEGTTTWMQGEIISKLITLGRLPPKAYDISRDLKYYNKERKLIFDNLDLRASLSAFYSQAASVVKMLDVATESKLGPCLGNIMNRNSHRSYTTYQLLDEFTSCPLSRVNATEFMKFWLFDSDVPILKLYILTGIVDSEEKSLLELSYSLLCPLHKVKYQLCPTANQLLSTPHFTLSFFNISGHMIMPTIIYDGGRNNSFLLTFDIIKNPLFLGNIRSKGTFLIQYPGNTYLQFMKWSLKNWVPNSKSGKKFSVSDDFFLMNPSRLMFFVTDMFELSRRNVISMEWLLAIIHWLGDTETYSWRSYEMRLLNSFKSLCIGYDLFTYLTIGNFTNGELEVLMDFMCPDSTYIETCTYWGRGKFYTNFFECPYWIESFADIFLDVLMNAKKSIILKELNILQ